MGGFRRTREVDDSQKLRALTEKNLILTHYMINTWWLQLLDGLRRYVIRPGSIKQVLLMTNNIMTLGYTSTKIRLNNTPDIVYRHTNISLIIAWTPSRLAWAPELRERE